MVMANWVTGVRAGKMENREPYGMQQYLNGESWKCPISRTGAHWWVEIGRRNSHLFECKYCKETRLIGKPVDEVYHRGKKLVMGDRPE